MFPHKNNQARWSKIILAIILFFLYAARETLSRKLTNNLNEPTVDSVEDNAIEHPKVSENPLISKIAQMSSHERLESKNWFRLLQEEIANQAIRQRASDKDHILMQQWLIDNINDLHRELKQTEVDVENYARVTKNLFATSERNLKKLSRDRRQSRLALVEDATTEEAPKPRGLRALILDD